MKDAELNEIFIFQVMVKIHQKLPILSTKMTISQKLRKLVFHPFQHIPHLLCKFEHF